MKLGRNRPKARREKLVRLADYLDLAGLPVAPPSLDLSATSLAPLRDVLGNDEVGNCTIAGALHFQACASGLAGQLVTPTKAQALSIYSAISGYKPGDPSTDTGCDEDQVEQYFLTTGFPDGSKLAGAVHLDATNRQEVMVAFNLFAGVMVCAELPDAWVTPFPSQDGYDWTNGVADPNNGHCYFAFGYDLATGIKPDSWGLFGNEPWDALAALSTEAGGGSLRAWLTPEMLAKGKTVAPNGVAWADLEADLKKLGGTVSS